MSKAKLKKLLSTLSKEQVVDIMLQLYDASKEANAWLEFYIEPNSDTELEKYKKAIRSQFYGRNDWPKDPSFRECNKLITAFKKLIPDPHAIADLIRQEVPKIERLKILREKAYRQLEILKKNQETLDALKKNLIEDTETM